MVWMVLLVLALGVANFALHRLLMESNHPILRRIFQRGGPWLARTMLALEYAVLVLCAILASREAVGAVWFYCGYTAINAMGAWLIAKEQQ